MNLRDLQEPIYMVEIAVHRARIAILHDDLATARHYVNAMTAHLERLEVRLTQCEATRESENKCT